MTAARRPSSAPVSFVLGSGEGARRLAARCALPSTAFLDVLDPSTLPFFRLLNAGNRRAFGGLGMPPWVQLDCCTLPTAMIGFARPRDEIGVDLWRGLVDEVAATFGADAAASLRGYRHLVPLAEYCALPSLEPGVVVGFSLFSLVPGLGLRAKALALHALAARAQIGIAQWSNRAVRTHARLGPLVITAPRAAPHSLPDATFVYRLAVPPAARLKAIAGGDDDDAPSPSSTHAIDVDHAAAFVADAMKRGAKVAIVAPGHVVEAGRVHVALRVQQATA